MTSFVTNRHDKNRSHAKQWGDNLFELIPEHLLATGLGALGGIIMGLAARFARFCTLGAIEDAAYAQNFTLIRMWGIAIGVAVLFVSVGMLQGWVLIESSFIRTVPFSPVLTILGGLIFGAGMAFAGNCGFGALSRLGGGELRAFVIILVMGITAYTVSSGVISSLSTWLRETFTLSQNTPGVFDPLVTYTGIKTEVFAALLAIGLFAITLRDRAFRHSTKHVFWGAMVGISVASGWIGMHLLSQYGFADMPIVSHSFTAPIGTTILYSMTTFGGGLNFAIGSVFGVWTGAVLGSLFKGQFRLEACEDPRELQRQIVGAILMGVGATFTFGCSVGQGLSAMAVLSVNAPIAIISIFIGARLGLSYLITGRFMYLKN